MDLELNISEEAADLKKELSAMGAILFTSRECVG